MPMKYDIIPAKDTKQVGSQTYLVYNKTQLSDEKYSEHSMLPDQYMYCGFCDAYRWHTWWIKSNVVNSELAVCDTCNNTLTSEQIVIYYY